MAIYKRRYIIDAPPLTKSQGIRALYRFHDLLRKRGYEAFMFCPEEHDGRYHYLDEIDERTRQNDVVVYSEAVRGNPLRFRNVARYVLYFPGRFGGETSYHESETVFTWDQEYFASPNQLWLFQIDDIFFDEQLPKTQDCCFVYKGGRWKEVPELEGLLEINMHYPGDRAELVRILKTTGTLYSFDPNSAILPEAITCGAKVKVVTADGFKDFTYDPPFSKAEVESQIDAFIEITQNMAYAGKLQSYPVDLQGKCKMYKRLSLLAIFKGLYALHKAEWLGKKIARYTTKLKRQGRLGVLTGHAE